MNCDPESDAGAGLEVSPLVADEAGGSGCAVTVAAGVLDSDAIEENSAEHGLVRRATFFFSPSLPSQVWVCLHRMRRRLSLPIFAHVHMRVFLGIMSSYTSFLYPV